MFGLLDRLTAGALSPLPNGIYESKLGSLVVGQLISGVALSMFIIQTWPHDAWFSRR
jgi:hypothetical protein